MNAKTKQILQTLTLGAGVVILTPIVGGFIGGIAPDIMATSILGLITVGDAISAGISAFGVQWAITQFWK